jgi:hypothetical protein
LTEYSNVVFSSASTNWHNLVVEEHHHRSRELADFMFIQHTIAMNIGPTIRCEYKKHGRLQHLDMPRDSVSLSPSDRTFFRRSKIEKNQLATVLHIALDSVLISQAAAALKKGAPVHTFPSFLRCTCLTKSTRRAWGREEV